MEIFNELDVKSSYLRAGAWVLSFHLLIVIGSVLGNYLKLPVETVMMAEMIDRQSSALVQNFKKSNDTKEVKDKKEVLRLSESAAETASEKKPMDGNPGAAAVYMPNAEASELNKTFR